MMNKLVSRDTKATESKAETLHLSPISFNVNTGIVDLLPIREIVGGGGSYLY